MSTSAAVVSGVLALTSISPAFAQGAGAKPPPAAAAAAPATPAAAAPAKPKKTLTERQKKEEAKRLYKEAETKFDAGDFAAAVPLYREADELIPGAPPKYKIAQAIDKQGLAVEAVAAWQAFLDAKPDADKFKEKITEAQERIEALKKTPAKVKVATVPEAPPNLRISVDGVPQASKELALAPGKHKLTVGADGFAEASQDVEVNFAEARDISVTLTAVEPPPVAVVPPPVEPPPVAPPPEPPPPEPRSPIPAYVTLGLAGVGAVVGTIFGIQALGSKSDFDDDPTTDNADAADRNALIADMSFAVALTFGVTGAVLLLSSDAPAEATTGATGVKKKTASQRTIVAPFVGPTGGGAAARFTF